MSYDGDRWWAVWGRQCDAVRPGTKLGRTAGDAAGWAGRVDRLKILKIVDELQARIEPGTQVAF